MGPDLQGTEAGSMDLEEICGHEGVYPGLET